MGERDSLVAEYIEKRGWFPGQSGSQTYGYEGVVPLGQVLGCGTPRAGAGVHMELALVPTPTSGQSEVFTQKKFGSFLHPNTQVEQKGQVSVLAGEGLLSPAEPGCQRPGSSQSRATLLLGPLATPAPAVSRLQSQGCGQEDALLAPLGRVPPQPPTPTACCKANNQCPRQKKHRHLGCKAHCPAQHHSLSYNINRESSGPGQPSQHQDLRTMYIPWVK